MVMNGYPGTNDIHPGMTGRSDQRLCIRRVLRAAGRARFASDFFLAAAAFRAFSLSASEMGDDANLPASDGLLTADFLAAGLLRGAGRLATAFLATAFLAAGFLAAGFLAAGFLAAGFLTADAPARRAMDRGAGRFVTRFRVRADAAARLAADFAPAFFRRAAADLACRESTLRDTVLRGSFSRTVDTARDTLGRRFGVRLRCPTS